MQDPDIHKAMTLANDVWKQEYWRNGEQQCQSSHDPTGVLVSQEALLGNSSAPV